jgi:hypothetical protein
MKQSRIMSRTQKTTAAPFLPTLPIEVWVTAHPLLTWSLVENEHHCIFQSQFRDPEHPWKYERFRGTEYVELAVSECEKTENQSEQNKTHAVAGIEAHPTPPHDCFLRDDR